MRMEMTAGDTEPLVLMLTENDLVEDPLDDTATARFVMAPVPESGLLVPAIDAAAEILDRQTPTVRYTWAMGETATPGIYEAQFVVTGPAGVRTFPTEALRIVIKRRAGMVFP